MRIEMSVNFSLVIKMMMLVAIIRTTFYWNLTIFQESKFFVWITNNINHLACCSPWGRGESDMTERLHFHFHALEKAMATHSSVLAWRIPGTGEPGGLPSVGLHRVGHDWSDSAAGAAREKAREQELTCRFTKVEGKHYWPVYGWLQWPEGGLSARKETHTVSVESSQEKLG